MVTWEMPDASNWDDRQLEFAFLRRFGEAIKVMREKAGNGHTVLIFHPVMAGA